MLIKCKMQMQMQMQQEKKDTIIEEKYYIQIYRASYSSCISSIYAIYIGQYTIAIVPGSVFLTSIHYWSKPDYSYRRYLDMIAVKCALTYQMYIAYNTHYANIYYISVFLAVSSYFIGIYYYHRQEYWKSTFAHIMLHLIANTGNMILYSGF